MQHVNDNDVVVRAWNTVLFDKFVRFKHLLIGGLASHSDELFSRRLFPPGSRVLAEPGHPRSQTSRRSPKRVSA